MLMIDDDDTYMIKQKTAETPHTTSSKLEKLEVGTGTGSYLLLPWRGIDGGCALVLRSVVCLMPARTTGARIGLTGSPNP
jgi:hypothetical protein